MSLNLDRFRQWFLAVFVGGVLIFVMAPLFVTLAMSFSDSYFVAFPPQGLTIRWYQQILTDRYFLSALTLSGYLAFGSTICALLIGIPAAMALARGRFPGRAILQGIILSPLIFPELVAGLALMQVLSAAGMVDARLNLLIGYTLVAAPYVVRAVTTSLLLVDANLEDAARTLGANRFVTFWKVTLPQIAPGVAAGAVFAFMISFDNLPMALWLADSRYSPVPLMLMRQLNSVFDPSIPAMSTVIIILALSGALVVERLVGMRRAASLQP